MYRAVIVTTPVTVYYQSGSENVETEIVLDAGDVLLFPSSANMRRIIKAHIGQSDGASAIINGQLTSISYV